MGSAGRGVGKSNLSNSGSSAHGSTRIRSRDTSCCVATWFAVSFVGAKSRSALRSASRRTSESGSHTSNPCVQTIDFAPGAKSFRPRVTGARFGCAASTNFARRRAARAAVALKRALPRSLPVNTNSLVSTASRCSSDVSFRLSSRHSMSRPAANSVITAATWRPARCTPPTVASSVNSPSSTRRVCQARLRNTRSGLRGVSVVLSPSWLQAWSKISTKSEKRSR